MKKQLKTNLFTAALGLGLFGIMLSSTTKDATAAAAPSAPISEERQVAATVAEAPTNIPFTVYLSLVTAFTNGQSIDFNAMEEDGQTSIWEKMTNWKEEQ